MGFLHQRLSHANARCSIFEPVPSWFELHVLVDDAVLPGKSHFGERRITHFEEKGDVLPGDVFVEVIDRVGNMRRVLEVLWEMRLRLIPKPLDPVRMRPWIS